MLGNGRLLQPRLCLISRIFCRLTSDPIAALNSLTTIAPRGYALRIDYLPFDMEAIDEEVVT